MELSDYKKWADSIVKDEKQYVCGQWRKLDRSEKYETLRDISMRIGAGQWIASAQEEAQQLSRKIRAQAEQFRSA